MRKIGNIKLNQFSKNELDQRKMNALKGGCGCGTVSSCSCENEGSPINGIGGILQGFYSRKYNTYEASYLY